MLLYYQRSPMTRGVRRDLQRLIEELRFRFDHDQPIWDQYRQLCRYLDIYGWLVLRKFGVSDNEHRWWSAEAVEHLAAQETSDDRAA